MPPSSSYNFVASAVHNCYTLTVAFLSKTVLSHGDWPDPRRYESRKLSCARSGRYGFRQRSQPGVTVAAGSAGWGGQSDVDRGRWSLRGNDQAPPRVLRRLRTRDLD